MDIYIASVYFILTTIYTIGYGDILSVSMIERVYNILIMAIGVLIYSFAISSLSTVISSYDTVTTKYLKNLEILEDMKRKYKNFDGNLYLKVSKFINYDFKFNKTDKYAFIGELPNITRNDLLYNMYKNMISNFTFFKYGNKFSNEDFNSKIVLNMRPVRLYKGDMILRENDRVNELVFVNQGSVSAQLTYNNRTAKIFELRKFDHFGDIFVLSNDGCPVDLMVKSKTCELFIISKDELLTIAKEFPEICNEIFRVSTKNYKRMKVVIDKKKKKLEYESGNKDNVISELLKLKKSDLNNSENEEEEENDDDEEEEEQVSNIEVDKKEKTKDLITTVNLDVIKEADENEDEEIKGEKDNEMQEVGEFSPIKSLAKEIDDKEYLNVFLNKVNFPDSKKHLKESFKDIGDNSKSFNLMQKDTFQSFKNFETKKDEILIDREENLNNYEKTLLTKSSLQLNQSPEEDSQSYNESAHNSIILGKKQYKEETTAPDVSGVNCINNEGSDKKNINNRIENDETSAFSNFKENGNQKNNVRDCSMIKDGLSHSSFPFPFPFSIKINSFKNIDNDDVKSQDFNDQNLFKNSKSSTNINSDTNLENVGNKVIKESDNINLTLSNDLKDNLLPTNDYKKEKSSIEENGKGDSLDHKKQEKTEQNKLENMFSLTKKDSDLGSIFSKDKNKINNSITTNELRFNNKFNKTTISLNENDNQKKNSILKFPESRKTITRLSKKDDALKPKKNIIQNIKSQIEASVKIDKDPTNFMLRELNKVEKKLIGYKRKEMKDLIIKLDEIYDLISKYK